MTTSARSIFRALADPHGREQFVQLAERTLSPEHYRLFRFHHLLGADWRLCTRRLQMSRGEFRRAVCDIEEQLGRALAQLEPRMQCLLAR